MLLLVTLITIIGIPLVLRLLGRRLDGRGFRLAIVAILICYAALVLYLTLASRSYYADVRMVLDPFVAYRRLIRALRAAYASGGWTAALKRLVNNPWVVDNIVPNILLLMPLGYLLPAAFRKLRRFWLVLLIGLLVSAMIEALQLVLHLGVFDVADIMHNTIGALIGYWLYWLIIRKGVME